MEQCDICGNKKLKEYKEDKFFYYFYCKTIKNGYWENNQRKVFLGDFINKNEINGMRQVNLNKDYQKVDVLIEALEYVASLENLFFAECSQAEEIVNRCKKALTEYKGNNNE